MLSVMLTEELFRPTEERLVSVHATWDGVNEAALESLEDWAQMDQMLDEKAHGRKIQWAWRQGQENPIEFYFDEIFVDEETENMAKSWIQNWRQRGILEKRFRDYEIPKTMREYLRVKYP